jgi:hypothetical protein
MIAQAQTGQKLGSFPVFFMMLMKLNGFSPPNIPSAHPFCGNQSRKLSFTPRNTATQQPTLTHHQNVIRGLTAICTKLIVQRDISGVTMNISANILRI